MSTITEQEQERERLHEMHRQYFVLLADIDDMQKKLSRIHNEILEDDKKMVNKLNDLEESIHNIRKVIERKPRTNTD